MKEWQPIETAPHGTAVWVWVDGQAYLGYCEPGDRPWRTEASWFLKASFKRRNMLNDDIFGCYAHGVSPTHWMPLPEPPTT